MSNNDHKKTSLTEYTIQILNELCSLILINEEKLDLTKCQEYIQRYHETENTLTGTKQAVRSLVQNRVSEYIETCPSRAQLFTFASDSEFANYRKEFKNCFFAIYYTSPNHEEVEIGFPCQFDFVFDYIQEAIDFYKLSEAYSILMIAEIVDEAKKEAQKATRNAELSAKISEKNAREASEIAAKEAINKVLDTETIENAVEEKINARTDKVISKVSEHSVTILGIFSGIVLTVVAGLFYSSSVIENINKADIGKLLCLSSLIGFVCIQIIALMFFFIVSISKSNSSAKNKEDNVEEGKHKASHLFPKILYGVVSIILVVIMIIFAFIPVGETDKNKDEQGSQNHQVTIILETTSVLETTSNNNSN